MKVGKIISIGRKVLCKFAEKLLYLNLLYLDLLCFLKFIMLVKLAKTLHNGYLWLIIYLAKAIVACRNFTDKNW